MTITKTQITDFRRKLQQPNADERASLLYALYDLGKSQKYLSKIFKVAPQQINQAFQGSQPTLMNKIKKHINILEDRGRNEIL
jgi:hypothetical protein